MRDIAPFLLIIFLVIWLLISMEFHSIAEMKGFSQVKYFWLTFFFGIVGILLIIALPDRNQPVENPLPEPELDELPKL